MAPILPAPFKVYVNILRAFGALPKSRQRPHGPRRVLIINLSGHLGDMVMHLPFLARLHAENPEMVLHAAVGKPNGTFAREIPLFERVHELDFGKRPRKIVGNYTRIIAITRYFVMNKAEFDFDICLLPRWGVDPFGAAYLAYLTGAPVRIGHDAREEHGAKETFPGTRLLLTRTVTGGHGIPEAARGLRLLERSGLASAIDVHEASLQPIAVLKQMAARAQAAVTDFDLPRQMKFGVIAPGASVAFRRWPVEHFVEVALNLRKTSGLAFVAIGSPAEVELGRSLESLSGGVIRNLVGRPSLVQLLGILNNADLFLGNDSGPAHIAGGLGIPTIVISPFPSTCTIEHLNAPLRVRPCGPRVRVVQPAHALYPCNPTCSFAGPHCIRQILPAEVILAAKQLVEDAAGQESVIS